MFGDRSGCDGGRHGRAFMDGGPGPTMTCRGPRADGRIRPGRASGGNVPDMRRRISFVTAAAAFALALGAFALAETAAADKSCGSFPSASYTIHVTAKGITCKRARAIMKEYWNGPDSRKIIHHGGSGADGWIKLKRYPGYTCYSGSGGGGCSNKANTKQANYSN